MHDAPKEWQRRLIRRLCQVAILILMPLVAPGIVEAHASLVRSTPAAGATLHTTPAAIVLEFTEALDPSFSTVRIVDSTSQVVAEGPGIVDPAAPQVLRFAVAGLTRQPSLPSPRAPAPPSARHLVQTRATGATSLQYLQQHQLRLLTREP